MNEVGSGTSGPLSAFTLNQNCGNESPEWAAQVILAEIMKAPEKSPMGVLQERSPNRDNRFYGDVITLTRAAVDAMIDGMHRATDTEPITPILIDRLSFTWKILRQAD